LRRPALQLHAVRKHKDGGRFPSSMTQGDSRRCKQLRSQPYRSFLARRGALAACELVLAAAEWRALRAVPVRNPAAARRAGGIRTPLSEAPGLRLANRQEVTCMGTRANLGRGQGGIRGAAKRANQEEEDVS